MKRGEIYFADLNPTLGSDINKRRPVLIISNDANNRRLIDGYRAAHLRDPHTGKDRGGTDQSISRDRAGASGWLPSTWVTCASAQRLEYATRAPDELDRS